jgi:type IV secretory pathway protease TraF
LDKPIDDQTSQSDATGEIGAIDLLDNPALDNNKPFSFLTALSDKSIVQRALMALWVVAIFALATFIVVAFAKLNGYFIAINDSFSFPHRVYLAKEGTPKIIKRGSIVIFQIELPHTPYEERVRDRDLFKKVACMEGDYLKRVENRFICYTDNYTDKANADKTNERGGETDEAIAIVQSLDSEGKPYAISFDYDGTIPKDKLFVVAPHYLSFDSRYFGLIDKSAVKGEILWAIY